MCTLTPERKGLMRKLYACWETGNAELASTLMRELQEIDEEFHEFMQECAAAEGFVQV